MASNIDATKPRDKDDLSQSVGDIRGNFGAAKTEIEALQTEDAALQQAINDHIDNPTGAHAASAISFASAVAGFTPTEVKAALDALAGVRIVDHNLDVPSPANGYYVRWANGLQVCYQEEIFWGSNDLSTVQTATWDYPSSFDGAPYVLLATANPAPYDVGKMLVNGQRNIDRSSTSAEIYAVALENMTSSSHRAAVLAIGRAA